MWIGVQIAAERLLAPCLSYQRRGRAVQELETVRAAAKPGQPGPIVGGVTCLGGKIRPAEGACTYAVAGRKGRWDMGRTTSEYRPAGLDRDLRGWA